MQGETVVLRTLRSLPKGNIVVLERSETSQSIQRILFECRGCLCVNKTCVEKMSRSRKSRVMDVADLRIFLFPEGHLFR